jgi:long-chain acyl-CoA synthetase
VIENRASSVADMFLDRVRESPGREAFRYPVGDAWVLQDVAGGR